jgi:hypothetical protein
VLNSSGLRALLQLLLVLGGMLVIRVGVLVFCFGEGGRASGGGGGI